MRGVQSEFFVSTPRPANEIQYNLHPKRKNNDLVAAMYALYCEGNSLEQIGLVYKRSRQAVYDVFRTKGYTLRSKKVLPCRMVDGIKFTKSHNGGYWRATSRKKNIFLKNYIWEKHNGPMPPGHGIHQKDLDRDNVHIENLELCTIAEISSKYSPHLNQFTSPTGSRKTKRAGLPTRSEKEQFKQRFADFLKRKHEREEN